MLTRRNAIAVLPAGVAIAGSVHSASQAEPSVCAIDSRFGGRLETTFPAPRNEDLLKFIRGENPGEDYLLGGFLKRVRSPSPSGLGLGNFFSKEEEVTFGKDDEDSKAASLGEFVKRALEYPDYKDPRTPPIPDTQYFIDAIKNTREITKLVTTRYGDQFEKEQEIQRSTGPYFDPRRFNYLKEVLFKFATEKKDDELRELLDPKRQTTRDQFIAWLLKNVEEHSDKIAAYLTKDNGSPDHQTIYQTIKQFPKGDRLQCSQAQGNRYTQYRKDLFENADRLWRHAYLAGLLEARAFLAAVQGFAIYTFILRLFEDPRDLIYQERARARILNVLSLTNDIYDNSVSSVRSRLSAARAAINNSEVTNRPYLGSTLRQNAFLKDKEPPGLPDDSGELRKEAPTEIIVAGAGTQSVTVVAHAVLTNFYLKVELEKKDQPIFGREELAPPYKFTINRILTDKAAAEASQGHRIMNDRKGPALASKFPSILPDDPLKPADPPPKPIEINDGVPGSEALGRYKEYLRSINVMVTELEDYYKNVQIVFHGLERLCQSFELLIGQGGVRAKGESVT